MNTLQISLNENVQQLKQLIDDLDSKSASISILGRGLTKEEQEFLIKIGKALPPLQDALTQLQS